MSDSNVTAPSRSSLVYLQYLRGIAALMVTYFHVSIQIPQYLAYYQAHHLAAPQLSSGVDVFFVISGFIIFISGQNSQPGIFFSRRLIRIAPLYWVLTLALAITALVAPQLFHSSVVTTKYITKSLLFVPYSNPGQSGEIVPLLVPGWSLNFEMFFYIVFSLVLFVPKNIRLLVMGIFLSTFVALGQLWGRTWPEELSYFADLRVLEFLCGMVLAKIYLKDQIVWSWQLSIVSCVTGFLMLVLTPLSGLYAPDGITQAFIERIIPATLVVASAVGAEHALKTKLLPPLLLVGDASYSLYLTHIFSLGLVRAVWSKLVSSDVTATHALLFIVCSMITSVAVALLTYTHIEQPLLRIMQGWIPKKALPRPSQR